MEQLRVDHTTEQELRRLIPGLYLQSPGQYQIEISNNFSESGVWRLPGLFFAPGEDWSSHSWTKWSGLSPHLKTAYVLGWRNVSFTAKFSIHDGKVSSTWYDLEPDVQPTIPASEFIVVRSAHGFWARGPLVPVPAAADESPDFRFGLAAGQFTHFRGPDESIAVAYTFEAAQASISQAYQVDLSCYWTLWGCDSVRQVVPLLWEKRRAIEAAAKARLASADPCPEGVFAGRVRTLPNLIVLRVVRSDTPEYEYDTVEILRGEVEWPWPGIRAQAPFATKPGPRYLYFLEAEFDSCKLVPATPSSEAAVRNAPSPKESAENDITWMWGRR